MIVFIKADGTAVNVLPTPVYKGSSLSGSVYLIAPYPPTNAVTVAFRLANGDYTKEYIMTSVGEIDGFSEEIAPEYNIWEWQTKNAFITEFSGTVTAQFKVTYSGEVVATSSVDFSVQSGTEVLPQALPQNPQAYWDEVKRILSENIGRITQNDKKITALTKRVPYNALLDFTVDEANGVATKTYADGTTAQVQLPIVERPDGEIRTSFLNTLTITADSWIENTANGKSGFYIVFSPSATGMIDSNYFAHLEQDGIENYPNQPSIEIVAHGGEYTNSDTVFKGSDGSLYLESNTRYAGRIILFGGAIISGRFIKQISYNSSDNAIEIDYMNGEHGSMELSANALQLGETSETAYAGDKGKRNADNIATLQGDLSTTRQDLATTKQNLETAKSGFTSDITALQTKDTELQAQANNIQAKADSTSNTLTAHVNSRENPHGVTKAQVGLGNVTDTPQIPLSQRGAANGVATLDGDGKIPTSQLPAYVSDVIERNTKADFPSTGQDNKIYVAKDTNLTYRWGGSEYVEISASLALGTTSATAWAGDKGQQNANNITELQGRVTALENKDGELQNAINSKQGALNEAQTNAVNSGITSGKVTTYDGYDGRINAAQSKADSADGKASTNATAITALQTKDGELQNAINGKQAALNATQMAAVNSGITATRVQKYEEYDGRINALSGSGDTKYVAQIEANGWQGASAPYTYTIARTAHGKGEFPIAMVTDTNNEVIYPGLSVATSGDITVYTNTKIAMRVFVQ